MAVGTAKIIATSTADNSKADTLEITVPTPTIDSVTITGMDTILKGDTISLTATVFGTNVAQAVTWSSNDLNVATVNSNGEVMAVTAGTVIITATSTVDGDQAASLIITVMSVNSVTITGLDTSVLKGSTLSLTATVSTTHAPETVTWSSSDEDVATVNPSTGEVTAIDGGTVNIISTSTVDSTVSDTVTITVISVEGISISILEGSSDSVLKGDTTFLTVAISGTNAVQSVDWTSDSN